MPKKRVEKHLIQAGQHASRGDRDQALDSINRALAIDPGEILITEILIAMERSDYTGTQNEEDVPADINANKPDAERNDNANMDSKLEKIFRLSDEALESGNTTKALAYLKKAVQLFPDEQNASLKLQKLQNELRAENLVKIGVRKYSEGDIEKAVVASRTAFDLFPGVDGLDELLTMIETAETTEEMHLEEDDFTIDGVEEEKNEQDADAGAEVWAEKIRTAVKNDNFEAAGRMIAEAVKKYPDSTLLDSFYSKLKRLGFVKVN